MIPEWFGYESVAQDWRKCSAFQITGRLARWQEQRRCQGNEVQLANPNCCLGHLTGKRRRKIEAKSWTFKIDEG